MTAARSKAPRRACPRSARLARRFVLLGALALLAAAGLAEFGRSWWIADLFGHFRFHYLAAALLLLLIAPLTRSPRYPILVLVACIPHLLAVFHASHAPAASPAADRTVAASGATIRVTSFNLQWNNADPGRSIAFLRANGADLILLQEGTPGWHDRIAALRDLYPHIAPANWRREFQTILLSKYPVFRAAVHPAAGGYTFLEARVRIGTRTVAVFGVHPPYPLSRSLTDIHRRYLSRLAASIRAAEAPVVLAGDFNLTPYSPRFRDFVTEAGLRPAAIGWRWPHTWPARTWFGLVPDLLPGIPIDHVLVSPRITMRKLVRGSAVGSDHFPITATLWVPD